jgi:hypothetical protein
MYRLDPIFHPPIFTHLPKTHPTVRRISPFARLQKGQRRGFGIPLQFLYLRYWYPVGAMPYPRSLGSESRNVIATGNRRTKRFTPSSVNSFEERLRQRNRRFGVISSRLTEDFREGFSEYRALLVDGTAPAFFPPGGATSRRPRSSRLQSDPRWKAASLAR